MSKIIDRVAGDVVHSAPHFMAAQMMIVHLHRGQTYGERPYYLHPIEVMFELMEFGETEIGRGFVDDAWVIAAMLHDTVEDTPMTVEAIEQIFDKEVATIVDLLTKRDELTYRENIERIIETGNVGAILVKLADNRVNLRNSPRDSLIGRYTMSISMLTDELISLGVLNTPEDDVS